MTTTSGTKLCESINLEYLCSYWATLSAPEVIGPLAEGLRINVYVTSGEVIGPKMRGRLRTVGGDWISFRPDGIAVLDVRATLELEGGALIYTTYNGVADFGPDGYQQFLNGNPPTTVKLRIAPRYYTGNSDYLWLNRLQCVGIGEVNLEQTKVSYDIYAMQ